ncbi:MAG: PIN domain-containing protein [Anaerolineae bacterium]
MIFVDTSAFLAILNSGDRFHAPAGAAWRTWITQDQRLITSNYIVLEATALVQHRLGVDAVATLHNDILPLLHIEWIDVALHNLGVNALLTHRQRQLSLVDCTSFALMRHLGIRHVFTFDRHFAEQGFICLP